MIDINAQSISAVSTPLKANGFVDVFSFPNTFVGWAGIVDERDADSAYIALILDGVQIGAVKRDQVRPDVTGYGPGPVGFKLVSSYEVSHRDVAIGRAHIELRTTRGSFRLNMSGTRDYSSLLVAVESLSKFAILPVDRFEHSIRTLMRDHTVMPDERCRVMACLELLHPERGRRAVIDLSDAFSRRHGAPETPTASVDLDTIELLSHFEGLGENCEFGFMQRHFGYEPISLLRWSTTSPSILIAALQASFEGVGRPEYTEFKPMWDDEYGTRDTRYGFKAHAHVRTHEVTDYDQEFKRVCQRISYLKRLFLERLAEGSKIFVFFAYDGISDQECLDLYSALRAHGPNRLLCVRADTALEGATELLTESAMVGYIDHFSTRENVGGHISYGSWLRLLAESVQVWSLK
jgi:hypothetical protein